MSPIGDGEFDAYRRHVPPPRKVCNCEQWATIAVEAEDIMAAIEGAVTSERKRTEGRPPKNDPKYTPEEWENLGKQLPKLADENKTAHKAAELVEKEKAERVSQSRRGEVRQIIAEPPSPDDQKTAHKAAELFNTNRTYVNQAAKPHF